MLSHLFYEEMERVAREVAGSGDNMTGLGQLELICEAGRNGWPLARTSNGAAGGGPGTQGLRRVD